ncbi:MAG: hypothetical protein HXY49_03740 [Ignavibacteriaceae bacterium]|nr:hypothetical protein [Ignavibacteriaceae bacterium]
MEKIFFSNLSQYFLLTLISLILFAASCDTIEPPPPGVKKPTLTLEQDEVTRTEVWLKLTTKDLTLPAELTLKQYNPNANSLSQIFVLNTQDSLLYIDSLLPNQNYSFQVSSIQHQVSSVNQQVTTLDTTSHNFTWQSWEFGQHSSSSIKYINSTLSGTACDYTTYSTISGSSGFIQNIKPFLGCKENDSGEIINCQLMRKR